jgi:hypothetical protein
MQHAVTRRTELHSIESLTIPDRGLISCAMHSRGLGAVQAVRTARSCQAKAVTRVHVVTRTCEGTYAPVSAHTRTNTVHESSQVRVCAHVRVCARVRA